MYPQLLTSFWSLKSLLADSFAINTIAYASDHSVVSLVVKVNITSFASPTFPDYSQVNWNRFRHCINSGTEQLNLNHILTNGQIALLIDHLNRITKHAFYVNITCRRLESHSLIRLDSAVRNSIARKRRLIRAWHRSSRSDPLKSLVNRTSEVIKQLVALARARSLALRASRIHPGPDVFREINKFAGIREFANVPLLLCRSSCGRH